MDGLDTSRLDELKTRVKNKLEATEMYRFKGTVSKLLGLTVEVKLPGLKVGDLCYIETKDGRRKPAEVQAFKGEVAQLLLLYDGEGIGQGSLVTSTGKPITIPVGDFLLGRLINPMGEPIDGKPLDTAGATWRPVEGPPPGPFERPIITEVFSTGVRAIDSCMTMGCGQRLGLFAGSGVGKSTLLGMIARNSDADVNVVALIGERGREVKEFVEDDVEELEVNIEGTEERIVSTPVNEPSLTTVEESNDELEEVVDYDNINIEDITGDLELDDFN